MSGLDLGWVIPAARDAVRGLAYSSSMHSATATSPADVDTPSPATADPKEPTSGASKTTLLLVLASACVATAAVWLAVIEVTNARAGFVLESLQGEPIHAWAPRYDNSAEVRLDLAVDANGDPLPDPLTDDAADRLDRLYADAAIKQHLYNILRAFGPVGYLLAIGGVVTGVMLTLRRDASRRLAGGGVVIALCCAVMIARMAWLGVLTRGLLTDWWG